MTDDKQRKYRIPRQRISLVREATIASEWKTYHNSREVYEFAREHLFADADRELFFTMMVDSALLT